MKYLKNDKAFTLVEIIIAIAALALVCGFVLQVFILATKVNDRAIYKQHAIIECSNVIEVLKSFDSIDEIYTDKYFENAKITESNGNYNISLDIDNIDVYASITKENDMFKVSSNAYLNEENVLKNSFETFVRFGN